MRQRDRRAAVIALQGNVSRTLRRFALSTPLFAGFIAQAEAAEKRLTAALSAAGSRLNAKYDGNEIRKLRYELRYRWLLPISRHGKQLMRLEPGIHKLLKVPHKTAGTGALVDAAKRFEQTVRPYRKLFVEDGLEKDFLTQLRKAARALHKRSRQTDTATRYRKENEAAFQAELKHWRSLLSRIEGHALDPRLGDLAHYWPKASRPGKPRGRPRKRRTSLAPSAD